MRGLGLFLGMVYQAVVAAGAIASGSYILTESGADRFVSEAGDPFISE